MKTALTELIEWCEEMKSVHHVMSPRLTEGVEMAKAKATELLELEKKQIGNAYSEGYSNGQEAAAKYEWGTRVKEITSEDYYNETFQK